MKTIKEILKEISIAYDNLESNKNLETIEAYRVLIEEVKIQFKKIPVKISFTDKDPYKTSRELFYDIDKNKRLKVFTGGNTHPIFTIKENSLFRAVHDYYGHYLGKNNFGYIGEVKAWLRHSKMFSIIARKALDTETIGQIAWFFNNGKKYAIQKSGILNFNFGG